MFSPNDKAARELRAIFLLNCGMVTNTRIGLRRTPSTLLIITSDCFLIVEQRQIGNRWLFVEIARPIPKLVSIVKNDVLPDLFQDPVNLRCRRPAYLAEESNSL